MEGTTLKNGKILLLWNKYLAKLNTPKGRIFVRLFTFLAGVFAFTQFWSYSKTSLPYISKNASNTNLGILVHALQNNWKIGLQVSIMMSCLSLAIIGFVASISNLLFKPLYLKLVVFSYLGVLPIVFIFTIVLVSTKPSDTTLIFSILSAIGASIAFCFTVFKSLKE